MFDSLISVREEIKKMQEEAVEDALKSQIRFTAPRRAKPTQYQYFGQPPFKEEPHVETVVEEQPPQTQTIVVSSNKRGGLTTTAIWVIVIVSVCVFMITLCMFVCFCCGGGLLSPKRIPTAEYALAGHTAARGYVNVR